MGSRPLGQEDPLEMKMATHFTILAWEIPWTGSLEGYSLRDRKESDMTEHALTRAQVVGTSVACRPRWEKGIHNSSERTLGPNFHECGN